MTYEVMDHVFAIHRDMGRFFDERIYKRELARRLPGVRLEVPVEVTFQKFAKTYFLDVLVEEGGLFEFKTVEMLHPRHRTQLLHYLFLADLAHGKLVNMRASSVEHEFVNNVLRPEERRQFDIATARWNRSVPGAQRFEDILVPLLRDWGTALELSLYEEAVTFFLGGDSAVLTDVGIQSEGVSLGRQSFRLVAPGVAFKLTALEDYLDNFESHARRLLKFASLDAILWANLGRKTLSLQTLE